jgi:hypothetical protein
MRRFGLVVLAVLASSSAFAQQGTISPGTIALDAMTTPGRHFGLGFYVTEHLSLRPSLGIGYSNYTGTFVNAGADLRYEFTPDHDWSAYATASGYYQSGGAVYSPAVANPGAPGGSAPAVVTDQGNFQYGGGVGVRRRINDKISAMVDCRYLHASDLRYATSSSFGQFHLDGQNQILASLGVSIYLH